VPNTTAIALNTDLDEALAPLIADGLDPQDGGVSVSTDHGDGVAGLLYVSRSMFHGSLRVYTNLPLLSNCESNESGGVASKIILASGLACLGPRVFFLWRR
jgi:hypothetical protein